MSPPSHLPTIHFHCRKCNEFTELHTIGIVLVGPICPICRRPMREIVMKQSTLALRIDDKILDTSDE